MKAALNGVPSLSVLDGWWLEGHVEGVTGWAIGEDGRSHERPDESARHASALYETLEQTVLPLFYGRRDAFVDVMRHAIALNGSFFTAQRMLLEYVLKAYGGEAVMEPIARAAAPPEQSEAAPEQVLTIPLPEART